MRHPRLSCVLVALILSVSITSCIVVPVPHKPQTAGPAGLIAQQPEAGFVQPGVTTREQLRQKAGEVEVPIGLPQHFWGRWTYQKWTVFGVAAAQTGAGGGSMDVKHTNNLLIDFDANGVVTQIRRVADRHMLREMRQWAAETSAPPETAELNIKHLHDLQNQVDDGVLVLRPGRIEISCAAKKKHGINVPLEGLTLGSFMRAQHTARESEAAKAWVVLRFPTRTKMGRNIMLEMNVADVYRLVEFTEHY